MTLQFYSNKAYNYVRETFNLALLAPSTIRGWFVNVQCEPGFSQSALNTLKQKVHDDHQEGKLALCNLILDKMAIEKQIDVMTGKTSGFVDIGTEINDDTMDCASKALVFMVVSLNSSWKLPITYYFIKSLTGKEKANLVLQALTTLYDVGVTITSITCDGPSGHFSMAENFCAKVQDVTNLCTYFEHPVTK